MNLPKLPQLGSRELMEHRARAVLVDADLWRERPTDLNASMLRDSVDQWRHARDKYFELTLVGAGQEAERRPRPPDLRA
jgi:hypothetical protein